MKSRVEKGKPAIIEPAKKKPRFTSNKVNKVWLHEHLTDPYVKLAQQHDYRSRAAFKLIGIDEQDKLIRPGMTVVDLGSTPGSWSQVARRRLARPALAPDVAKADDACRGAAGADRRPDRRARPAADGSDRRCRFPAQGDFREAAVLAHSDAC